MNLVPKFLGRVSGQKGVIFIFYFGINDCIKSFRRRVQYGDGKIPYGRDSFANDGKKLHMASCNNKNIIEKPLDNGHL